MRFSEHVLAEASFLDERLIDLPHLVDPTVRFWRHTCEPALGRGERPRVELSQVLLQSRENARLMGRREGENAQRYHAFAQTGEAGLESRRGADGVADDADVEELGEIGGKHL